MLLFALKQFVLPFMIIDHSIRSANAHCSQANRKKLITPLSRYVIAEVKTGEGKNYLGVVMSVTLVRQNKLSLDRKNGQ
jgi:hypothetical protein